MASARNALGEYGFFFVFQKWLRAQRVGRVAPRRGGAKRRAAALGAAQRRKAPPQAAERRAAHEACFPAFYFAPIIDKEKELTEKGVGNCPILRQRQSLGSIFYDLHRQYESCGRTYVLHHCENTSASLGIFSAVVDEQ